MSGGRVITSAEYRELFDRAVQNQFIASWWRNHLKAAKLQNCQNGLQQFRKLIALVFLLQIFSWICRCFACIIEQLLDSAYE